MPSAPSRHDVVVLGAGIMGCALAHHLRREGVGSVVLYDGVHPCAGASGASVGALSPFPWDPWERGLVRESAQEYREISEKWGLGAYRECGGLWAARNEKDARWLERQIELARREGDGTEAVGPEVVARLLPAGDLSGARVVAHVPHEALLSSSEMTFAYAELASQAGVDLRWGWGAPAVERHSDGWRVRALGGEFSTTSLVLACGAWTGPLLRELGQPLPLSAFRAEGCRLRPGPLASPFPTYHEPGDGLLVRSAPGGRLLVTGGAPSLPADPARANPAADFAYLETIAGRFQDVLPGWAGSNVEGGWAGVCAATPDGHPLVGPIPGAPGLFVAAGFNGSGVMRAGAIARRFASAFVAGSWTELGPALPSRFPEGVRSEVPAPRSESFQAVSTE